jgi:tRNA pseudouridine55 synthase
VSGPPRSGVLVVDKPAGVTSFDVVARARQRLAVRRVGHAGTLDPDAVGVLPLLLGEATKLVPYLMDQDKAYLATLQLGVTTDTLDLRGVVRTTAPVAGVTIEAVREAARSFIGRIQQVPPMYSAVHHEGRRLYELAREGVEVERRPREVVVHALEVEAVEGASVKLRIVCGKGTYVRSLAADLGAALGCGAAVAHLVRTRVGPYEREGAVGWSELEQASRGALWEHVRAPETALAAWPEVRLDERAALAFVNGQSVPVLPVTPRGFVRVHDDAGQLIGVGDAALAGRVRPLRILHVDRPGTRALPV